MDSIEQALIIALDAHRGQRDKVGAPYILHVLDVWHTVRTMGGSEKQQIVALLHDVLEDVSDQDLPHFVKRVTDLGAEIYFAVDAITKRKTETRAAYLERVKQNPIARAVKAVDSADNYRRAGNIRDPRERERLEAKYKQTLEALDS